MSSAIDRLRRELENHFSSLGLAQLDPDRISIMQSVDAVVGKMRLLNSLSNADLQYNLENAYAEIESLNDQLFDAREKLRKERAMHNKLKEAAQAIVNEGSNE